MPKTPTLHSTCAWFNGIRSACVRGVKWRFCRYRLLERRLHVSWCAVLDFYWFFNTPQEQLQNQPAAIKNQQITCKYPAAVVREVAAAFFTRRRPRRPQLLVWVDFCFSLVELTTLPSIQPAQTTYKSIRSFVPAFPLKNQSLGVDNCVALAFSKVLISIHWEKWTKARSLYNHGGSAFTWAIRPWLICQRHFPQARFFKFLEFVKLPRCIKKLKLNILWD